MGCLKWVVVVIIQLYTFILFLKISLNWVVSRLVRKGTCTKPGDLDLIPNTHRVKGENQPPQNTK